MFYTIVNISANHYVHTNFRLEQTKEPDAKEALMDLVHLVTSLTTYGINELRPTGISSGAPFLLPGFAVPQPTGKGNVMSSFLMLM